MDFGDYVRARRKDKIGMCTGIAVCRVTGGIGILTMGNESVKGEVHCCLRRGAQVLDLYNADCSTEIQGVDRQTACFINIVRKLLSADWNAGNTIDINALIAAGLLAADNVANFLKPSLAAGTPQQRLSGDLLNRCVPGSYGAGKRR